MFETNPFETTAESGTGRWDTNNNEIIPGNVICSHHVVFNFLVQRVLKFRTFLRAQGNVQLAPVSRCAPTETLAVAVIKGPDGYK